MTDSSPPPTADPGPASGRGGIGVLGAAAIGVGGMVGGGIFAVLGTAVDLAGGGTPVAFAVAGVVALLTSYSYAKLSVRFPSAGGTIVFVDRAFGVDFATGVLNLLLWLSYLVTIALYASAFGAYGTTFFSEQSAWLRHLLTSSAIVLPAVLNALDASIVSKSETAIVVLKLSLLAVVVAAGIPHVDAQRLSFDAWSSTASVVAGGMVIFVAYEGFELIANAAPDVRTPETTLPRAFYGCVLFVIALYVLVAAVTVGSVPADVIAEARDYALAEAARPSLGHAGFVVVAVAALFATLSAINATVYGNARLGFSPSKDGELPDVFERRTWSRPLAGVALTAGLSLLLANLVDLKAIAIVIPNKNIIDEVLVNHSKHGETRIDVPVGIAYKEDIARARSVLLEAVEKLGDVVGDPAPQVAVCALGASSVDLEVRVWIDDAAREKPTYVAVMEAAKLSLDAAGIEIPFPHLQLFVEQVEERVWERAVRLRQGAG